VFCSYDANVSERADTVSISFSCSAIDNALQQWLSASLCSQRRAFEAWVSLDFVSHARLSRTPHTAPAPSRSTGCLRVLLCTAADV
jgi:hypothetical protein